MLGQHEKAAELLEKVHDNNPEFSLIYRPLIATYIELGRVEDAEWTAEELLTLVPGFSLSQEKERAIYRDEQVGRRYIESLRNAGIE